MKDDIYYLLHKTKDYNEDWKKLKTSNIDNSDDQFPGVYLTLITKDNINNERLYPGKYGLIFSRKLLNQKNYHININDNNGMITETDTYYPWNIDKALYKIKISTEKTTMNEVVFHDPISMEYLCEVIKFPTAEELANLSDEDFDKYRPNSLLPEEIMENDFEPDMTKEPFYCYPQDNYTGVDKTSSSSKDFLETMAKVCNINTNTDKTLDEKELFDKIKKKIPHLYSKRNEQNIQALKDFTNKDKIIGGRKIKKVKKRKRKTKKMKKRKRKRTLKRKQK
jgi:hypothetical protein